MVLGEVDGLARATEHAAGVPSISDNVFVRSHEDDIGSATSMAGNLLILRDSSGLIEFFGAVLDELIHELEGLNERIPVVLGLVTLEFCEIREELALHKLADLMS